MTESTRKNAESIDPNDMGDTIVIPYPSEMSNETEDMLFAFGSILGSIIRDGLTTDIPFPTFVWEVYVDPLCPICSVFWPVFKQIIEAYPTNLRATVHFLPLPYHT